MFNLNKLGEWAAGMAEWTTLVKKIQNDDQFKSLFTAPVFQELISDPEIVQAIKAKNYMKLLGNSKFRRFLSDPEIREILQTLK